MRKKFFWAYGIITVVFVTVLAVFYNGAAPRSAALATAIDRAAKFQSFDKTGKFDPDAMGPAVKSALSDAIAVLDHQDPAHIHADMKAFLENEVAMLDQIAADLNAGRISRDDAAMKINRIQSHTFDYRPVSPLFWSLREEPARLWIALPLGAIWGLGTLVIVVLLIIGFYRLVAEVFGFGSKVESADDPQQKGSV